MAPAGRGTGHNKTKALVWYLKNVGVNVTAVLFWIGDAITGQSPPVQVRCYSQAQGAGQPNTLSVWVDGVRKIDFTNLGFTHGWVTWGSERQNSATVLGGSFAQSKYYTGSQWFFISYGLPNGVSNDPQVHFEDRSLFSQHSAFFEAGNQ